ncbi:serine hydrolase domain-containing protein [Legionella hackeliae]|uniref:Beta-lactamase n=2 Tax=Legionella hackeliae TaxID=449 RepID=A0A0A8UP74_LEGHA
MPNYSEAPKINYLFSKNLRQYWSQDDLINLIYSKDFNPPRKPGYFYSNTGYVLMDKILTKAYKTPFKALLIDKIINPLQLKNTYYPVPEYPPEVLSRLVRGYGYNIYDNPELLGQDVTENNLSWAGAAGALVANSEDVIHWVEHLFIENKLLTKDQQQKMQQLVSLKTGLPITTTTEKDPQGFGLGIAQNYDAKIGRYWFYEGQTLGYRAIYIYVPCNKVIISTLFNSATNGENDHTRELMVQLYNYLLSKDEMLICGKNKMDT